MTPGRKSKYSLRPAWLAGLVLLAACSKPPPTVSVAQFMDNPRLLEATMVRCAQNRAEMKYETECVNARDAVNRLAAAEEQAKRQQMEAQSERKRQALRRTQEAAAEARRRALEAQRLREEAEYLGLFEEIPPGDQVAPQPAAGSVAPQQEVTNRQPAYVAPAPTASDITPATATKNTAPGNAVTESSETDAPVPGGDDQLASDLQSIREELRRRKAEQQQN